MTALAAARVATARMGDSAVVDLLSFPVKGSTTIYAGALVGLSAGYLVPMSSATGLVCLGRAEKGFVNAGADGAADANGVTECEVRRGTFKWANSASTDAIGQADVGKLCYAVDDQTVALTDNNGARSIAGVIVRYESGGIWVETEGFRLLSTVPKLVINFPITLANVADGQLIGNFTPGFAGRIIKTAWVQNIPVTTAAKTTTLTPRIATTNVTGGVVVVTSALATPMGAVIAGSTITANNVFTAVQALNVQASLTTAFVEGSGTFQFYLG